MTATLRNPILPGFHPDPCILRVDNDYWIATSTFEWFPGVRLHHSRDLVHWEPVGYALDRVSQLDMRGNPRSGGIWAPALSYAHSQFHLVYTDVKTWGFGFDDCHNYLVTADRAQGPYSEPIYLNSSGFDPSLFTDEDGSQWLVNLVWDPRPGHSRFGGIVLQAYDRERRRLVGDRQIIFRGTSLGFTEGPHLFRHLGRYYLVVAEGGTSYDHAMTVARADRIEGPYEPDPAGPIVTARGRPELALQKTGHGSFVETPGGEWFVSHLTGRPVGPERRCILGRETALQRVVWTDDGWPRLVSGDATPAVEVPGPDVPPHPLPKAPPRDDFDLPMLGVHWQTLRIPADPSWLSLTERPGWLRLRGQESPRSLHRQSVVGRRVTSLNSRFETLVEADPEDFQQMAGLLALYDDEQWYYAYVSRDEEGRHLIVMACEKGDYRWVDDTRRALPPRGGIRLQVTFADAELSFAWGLEDGALEPLGPALDATLLSDEGTSSGLGFTGAFVAVACHDVSGRKLIADFDYVLTEET